MVVDASVIVAAMIDLGPDGAWAEAVLTSGELLARDLALVESANIPRRLERSKKITELEATAALHDLVRLDLMLMPFEPFAERVWQLRATVTSYDAWYVAMAEALQHRRHWICASHAPPALAADSTAQSEYLGKAFIHTDCSRSSEVQSIREEIGGHPRNLWISSPLKNSHLLRAACFRQLRVAESSTKVTTLLPVRRLDLAKTARPRYGACFSTDC